MKFYRGVVENNEDPEMYGRVQVRIFGIHPAQNSGFETVETDHLPWAEVIGGTDFGLISGVGVSSVLHKGTWVWVVLEEDDPGRPIVLGVLHGVANTLSTSNYRDPDGVYPKSDRVGRSDYHPNMDEKYTKLQVIETECGHRVELDDSDSDQRILIYHTSGTQILIDNTGVINITGVQDENKTISNNVTVNVGGNVNITVGGSATIQASSSITLDTPTVTATGNMSVAGTLTAANGTMTASNGSMSMSGTITASGDVVGSGVSLSGHTHPTHDGTTGTPS